MHPHSPPIRRIYALASAIALLAAACGNNSPDTPGAPSAGLTDPSTADAPIGQIGQIVEITVADGSVVGDTERIDVALGEQLTIRLAADVEDKLHVHGYDFLADVTPGQPSDATFTADIPGVFEIHLEDLGIQVARLQVS